MVDAAWDERLAVPRWAWPLGLALALVVAAQVHSGVPGWRAVVPYVVAPPVVLGVLGLMSRGRVRVADGVLHAPGARVPLSVVGAARALDAESTRLLRGPAADVRAHVAMRPWLRRAVQVRLEDPDDDTPYWLVGTRRPEQLAAVLQSRAGMAT